MSKQNTLIAVAAFLVAGISGSYTALVNGTAAVEPTQTMEKTEFASTDPGFKPMFTEDSFEGWVQLGGKAKYEIKDGVVTGTCVPGQPNAFMSTGMDYTNFEMDVEFKVHPKMNSGIQIRSNCYANKTEFKLANGKVKKIPSGRVHGYQVEIDPSERSYSGGIYDEARRGWLNKLDKNEAARKAFKANEWNHYRIKCDGDHIQTWINGVAAADLKDDVNDSGLIGLQVHGANGREEMFGSTVQWRNIRIKLLD